MNVTATDSASQRSRILARLREGAATSIQLIQEENVLRPSARIAELRAAGHQILTYLQDVRDPWGRQHSRVALYYLKTGDGDAAKAVA